MQIKYMRSGLLIFILFIIPSFFIKGQDAIVNYTKENALTSNEITCWFVDSKGTVWLGTSKGLSAYAGDKWYQISHIEDNTSGKPKPIETVETIYGDHNGNIFVSSSVGLFFYNYQYWISFDNPDDSKGYVVKDFYEDRKGRVWTFQEYLQDFTGDLGIILHRGTIHMFDGSNWFEFDSEVAGTSGMKYTDKSSRYFTDFMEISNGELWVTSLDGLFSFNNIEWTEHKEKDINAVKTYAVVEGIKNDIWVATDNGVSRYFEDEWTNYAKKDGLSNSFFHHLDCDSSGRIWAYTSAEYKFNGLNMYDGRQWNTFKTKDLQIKGSIQKLVFLESEVIALTTNGLSRFKSGAWNSFNRESGLKGKKYNLIVKNKTGIVWLAGDKRLYKYDGDRWRIAYEAENEWEVSVIFFDNLMNCWVGTKKSGVFKQNTDKSWIQYNVTNGLTDNRIKQIFEDKSGNIWVISAAGVSVFKK